VNRKLRFFLDFDGTISTADVVDLILERFGEPSWRDVEKEWADGKIGSRECLSRQLALTNAPRAAFDTLISTVDVDPGFVSFLKTAAACGVPVTVVSDGFDLAIHQILARMVTDTALLKALPVFANRLEFAGDRPKALFPAEPCGHGCANCKPAVIDREKSNSDYVVFVGDGLSDRFAAKAADMTFAKGKLLEFCRSNRILHREYAGFGEIEEWLKKCHAGQAAMHNLHLYS
jgi:2,3-diketo-5-methylthio-1-phosphopentane phosphatase